jgi:hypothetical protein
MTPEVRLKRLERLAMLLVRAGYRARKQFRDQLREHDRMINHAFDLQIANEQKFAQNEERFSRYAVRFEERFARNEKRFTQLVESQVNTDRRLNSLIEIIKEGRNGGSSHDEH